ncbi:MAG: HEPN domain-containing protein [Lachnospirales bacterium]
MNDKVKYWISIAEYDLETAEAMLKTERLLYVGFMCHQTIEKMLKAVIEKQQVSDIPPKIHNLLRLANIAKITLPDKYVKLISYLNPLNIEARYPTYKNNLAKILTKDKCQDLLYQTREMKLWIEKELLN